MEHARLRAFERGQHGGIDVRPTWRAPIEDERGGRLDQIQHEFGTIIKHQLRAFRRQQLHRLRARDTALRQVWRITCKGAKPRGQNSSALG
eukprot:scaffold28238_cov59-Phaeocystis_antarctica.AAC.3